MFKRKITALFQVLLLVSSVVAINVMLSGGVYADGPYSIGITPELSMGGNSPLSNPSGTSSLASGLASSAAPATSVYNYKVPFTGLEFTGGWGHLVEGAGWALLVVGAIQLIGNFAGLGGSLTNSLSIAAVAGIMSYKGLLALGQSGFQVIPQDSLFLQYAPGIGIAVAAITFVLLYKEESKKVVTLQCLPWEAPVGGNDCERCNGDPLKPCSEYRCKSLGQACELVNKGSNEERCVWVARNDVNSPTIQPWSEALEPKDQNLRFVPDNAIRPPNRGVKIVSSVANGCIRPYTPLKFGIVTDEPAQCKIDTERPNSTAAFDSMEFYFGNNNYYRYNHTQEMRLPSPQAVEAEAEGLELENNGLYNYYVRCRDANGNENVDDFLISFCVDPSPDTTPPIIESTSIISGSPVSFGVSNVSLTVNVNEPAECRWSIQDKSYEDMENSMSCSTRVYQQNAQQLYPCNTVLTGIRDRENNLFYFRCKDKPQSPEGERNVNSESYKFSLRGSQALNIIKIAPNETVTGSTDSVPVNLTVETSNGANEGRAICYFSPSGDEGSFVAMFNTDSFKHNQILTLGSGNYRYRVRCVDAGGNAAEEDTEFSVFTDRRAPLVTRVYREGSDALKLVTDEDAVCTYSTSSCNFNIDEGLKMIYNPANVKNSHFTKWDSTKTYYIRCKDDYGNQPSSNSCSIVVKPSDLR